MKPDLLSRIENHSVRIGIIGLGYVGLPLALRFCEENFKTVGFVGKYAFIGVGFVLTRDIPDYALLFGNPAKIKGWMCECGVKLGLNDDFAKCKACGEKYKMIGEKGGCYK